MPSKQQRFFQEVERGYEAGEVIFEEGEVSRDMCVIPDLLT